MSIVNWFFVFVAVFGWISGIVGLRAQEKTEKENRRLRDALKIEHNRANYFRAKSEHEEVFDFEKVNSKKEK